MISKVEFDEIFDDLAHFAGIAVESDFGISDGVACPCEHKYIYDVRDNPCWHLIAIFEYPNDCLGRTNAELSNKVVDIVEQHFHMKLEDMLYIGKPNKSELATTKTWSVTKDDIENLKRLTNSFYGIKPNRRSIYDYTSTIIGWRFYVHLIDRVIFNDPATIILWKSGEKTVVKCGPNETFDKEKGLAMALCKYILGNRGNFNEFFKKFMKEEK